MASRATTGVTFQLTGDKRLDALFRTLPTKVQKKVLRNPLREAAKIVHKEAKRRIPKRSGLFRKSLKVKAARRSRKTKNTVKIILVTGKGFFQGEAFYGSFVEFGHRVGRRQKKSLRTRQGFQWVDVRKEVPGRHDIEQAYRAKEAQAKAAAVAGIAAGIVREAQSAGITA